MNISFRKLHFWFIRLITKQVELVIIQLEINKLMNSIKDSTKMIAVPKIYVSKPKKKKIK